MKEFFKNVGGYAATIALAIAALFAGLTLIPAAAVVVIVGATAAVFCLLPALIVAVILASYEALTKNAP